MEPRPPSDAAPRPGRPGAACPICRRPVARDAAGFPFCSERCKLIDLGRWLGGQYRIELPIDPLSLEGRGWGEGESLATAVHPPPSPSLREGGEGGPAGSGAPDGEPPSEGTP
ncbi:MAG: DNA gyrase inhibitor YacG [Planctomycetes bacterium]|nr:DNA gyrase inhibitor YacG [Planctomycetota bacterium]